MVHVDIAVQRILSGRPKLKYYEAGMDLNFSNDPYRKLYGSVLSYRIIDQYNAMVDTRKLCHRRRNNGDRVLSKISEIKCNEDF